MELKELEHFIAVVEYDGFSKAASHIYVSQPTLSKSIKKLEERLNVILFERSTRSLSLTDAGQLVYDKALKILSATEELRASLDDLLHLPSGEIKIGIPPLIGTLFFPMIAKKFNELHPQISLQLIEHGAKRIEFLIEEGKVDVGIVVLPVNNKKFTIEPFIHEEFKLFLHPGHALASRELVALPELKNERFILFNQEFSLHHLIINTCELKGHFTPQIAYESSQWDVIAELVAAELGITLLPKTIYTKMNPNNIVAIPIESPPMWELAIITKKDRYQSYALRSLLQFLNKQGSEFH